MDHKKQINIHHTFVNAFCNILSLFKTKIWLVYTVISPTPPPPPKKLLHRTRSHECKMWRVRSKLRMFPTDHPVVCTDFASLIIPWFRWFWDNPHQHAKSVYWQVVIRLRKMLWVYISSQKMKNCWKYGGQRWGLRDQSGKGQLGTAQFVATSSQIRFWRFWVCLYSDFGMKFRRRLQASAIPVIRLSPSDKQDKPTRPAAMKRERRRSVLVLTPLLLSCYPTGPGAGTTPRFGGNVCVKWREDELTSVCLQWAWAGGAGPSGVAAEQVGSKHENGSIWTCPFSFSLHFSWSCRFILFVGRR